MSTDQSVSAVEIRLFGEITIRLNGQLAELPDSMRAVALLGWLAVHPGPHPRATIASALWPDVIDSSARQSVRTALWSLRRAFGDHADDVLDTSRSRIGLRNVSIDVQRFDQLITDGQFDEAFAFASGELLAGLDDEWAMRARESHRDRLIALLSDQSDKAAADGNFVVAIDRARRAAELNPLSESCARLLMRRHDEAGDRSVALAVYARMVERLRRELKIGPSEETWRLAEKIRNRHRVHSLRSSPDLQHRQSRRPALVGR
ncbi:MAG: hypothetical protein QOH57_5435, partial [Mycobacterium sp.]|nr:hypothetical protein [Mycobacterium sp.]